MANIKKVDKELEYINHQIELQVPEAVAIEGAGVLTAAEVMVHLEEDDIIFEYEIVGNNLFLFTITNEMLSCYSLNEYDTELDQYLLGEKDTIGIESLHISKAFPQILNTKTFL